ncbi:hypothetical protein ES708_25596 [subsurface metagenome]
MADDYQPLFLPQQLLYFFDEDGQLPGIAGGGGELKLAGVFFPAHTPGGKPQARLLFYLGRQLRPAKIWPGEVNRQLLALYLLGAQLAGLGVQLVDGLLDIGQLVEHQQAVGGQKVEQAVGIK